jgi:hypothetical protein
MDFLALVLIIFVIAASGIATAYFYVWIPQSQNNSNSNSNANPQPGAQTTTQTIDYTQKCNDAGGICLTTCSNSVTGSTGGSFFQSIQTWLYHLFAGGNSSVRTGAIVSASYQQIGSYPDYCTVELPNCCISVPTQTQSGTQTATSNPGNAVPLADQEAINTLDSSLNASLNYTGSDISNALLNQ